MARCSLSRRFSRRVCVPLAAAVASGCLLLAGCGAGDAPDTVPVSGRVTLNGGPWPKAGTVNFTPFKPAEGYVAKPGVGHFDTDGNYQAKTGELDGLVPGNYRISITCWETPPGDNTPGKVYGPEKYQYSAQSGLTLDVKPDSGSIDWSYDVKSAQ